jgi:hypothetical protein
VGAGVAAVDPNIPPFEAAGDAPNPSTGVAAAVPNVGAGAIAVGGTAPNASVGAAFPKEKLGVGAAFELAKGLAAGAPNMPFCPAGAPIDAEPKAGAGVALPNVVPGVADIEAGVGPLTPNIEPADPCIGAESVLEAVLPKENAGAVDGLGADPNEKATGAGVDADVLPKRFGAAEESKDGGTGADPNTGFAVNGTVVATSSLVAFFV